MFLFGFGKNINSVVLFSIIFRILLIIVLVPQTLFAADEILSAKISPLNRLSIKLTELPKISPATTLSSDKKTITIALTSTKLNNEFSNFEILGEGIIKKVLFKQTEEKNIITVNLSEARGYTISSLPYSKNIILEVFDWSSLSEEDEAYRTGLLNLEDDILEEAKSDLLKGTTAGIADAAAYLGLILLKEGKINSALKNMIFAEIKESKIPDIFAAISQIYEIKQDLDKSKYYSKLYMQQTGEKSSPKINLPVTIEKDDFCLEPTEHLNSIINSKNDTNNSKTNIKDTSNKFENLLAGKDSTAKYKSFFDEQYINTFKYIIYFIIAAVVLLIYLYLKWRKQQLLLQEKNKQEKTNILFQNIREKKINHNDATTTNNFSDNKPNISKTDFKNFIDKTITNSNSNSNSKFNPNIGNEEIINSKPSTEKNIREKNKTKPALEYPKTEEERSEKAKELLSIMNEFTHKENSEETKYQKQKKRSANIELAMHLAEEQKKIKNRNISNIPSIIELDNKKIIDIAKKLGVEKSGIETKQNLEKIKNDDREISKLGEKFGIK